LAIEQGKFGATPEGQKPFENKTAGETARSMFMKQRSFLSVLCGITLVLACASALTFSVMACDGVTSGGGTSVPSDLRGAWERTEADWWYEPGSGYQSLKGTLVIKYNSVTISGPVSHLQGFTQDIALEAYAEDGLLYIKDTGEWKSPVAYRRWKSADYKDTLITLIGGSVGDETLKRIGN
jgi:hypothetical protein